MKRLFLLLFFISQLTYAQVEKDSLFQKADSLKAKFEKPIQSIDSTAAATKQKIDSIKNEFNERVDSLQASYQRAKGKIVAAQTKIQQKIDSLRTLKLPTEKLQAKADSLQKDLTNLQKKVTSDIDSLKLKVANKFNSLKISPEAKAQVAKYSSTLLGKVDLPFIDKGLFNKTEIGEVSMQLPGIDQPNLTENLPGLENGEIPGIDGSVVKEKLGPVSEIKAEAKEIREKIEDGQVMVVVEEKAQQLEEVGALKKVLPSETAVPVPDGTQTQQEMVGQVKKAAINHFAGKAAVLQAAMDDVTKFKGKYDNVQNVKELTKKQNNELRGKPFYERLVESITLQPFKNKDWMIDVSPYLGYRFTSRISAGLGWNQRIIFNGNKDNASRQRVYGPRVYGEYAIKKGFSARLELETMNTFVRTNFQTEAGGREWVPAVLAGMKKDYRISGRLKGTGLLLYNFYNPDYKSPYGDRLNVRMGFEYTIAKRTAKKAPKTKTKNNSKTKRAKESKEIKVLEEGEVPNPEYREKN